MTEETPLDRARRLTARMRKASRQAHSISDGLVNARLAAALADRAKWAIAMSAFHAVISEIEIQVARAAEEGRGGDAIAAANGMLPIAGRAERMAEDVAFLRGGGDVGGARPDLGVEAAAPYVARVRDIARGPHPELLLAYQYTLHMGFLSGGRIIATTARRAMSLQDAPPFEGTTAFAWDAAADDIKAQYKRAVDAVGDEMDADLSAKLCEETGMVFRMNNALIRRLPLPASWQLWWVVPPSLRRKVAWHAAAVVAALGIAAALAAYRRTRA